ncbi:MAG TPA: DUF4232 domain-containing protein [Candidatus Limnocylindrales bacterium]
MGAHRRLELVVLLLGAAVALAGCQQRPASSPSPAAVPSASPSPQQSSSPATPSGGGGVGVRACGLDQLTITISEVGKQEGGAGHSSTALLLRNSGTTRCSLSGYPKVVALDSTEAMVSEAQQTLNGYMGGVTANQAPTVELAPGQAASALFEALTANADGTACRAYAALRVTPPGQSGSVTVRWGLAGCAEPQIHPIVAGESGRG